MIRSLWRKTLSVSNVRYGILRRESVKCEVAIGPRPEHFLRRWTHSQRSKSRNLGFYLLSVVVGMVGMTYASVPLYRMFCNATGFAGTIRTIQNVEEKLKDRQVNRKEDVERSAAEREITVWFEGNVVDGMEWSFEPTQRNIKVHPGQSTLAFFRASNKSDKAITGISTYNVAPHQTGYYFNKIQCFCFENQKLRPGESVDMPVFFYIDPEFAIDRKMADIDDVTLSYTFFKVSDGGSPES